MSALGARLGPVIATALLAVSLEAGFSAHAAVSVESAGPRQAFDDFIVALVAGDGEAVRALVHPNALKRCAALRRPGAEKTADRADRVFIVALRRYERLRQSRPSCETLVRELTEATPHSGVDPRWFSLGSVVEGEAGSAARGSLSVAGAPSGIALFFRREGPDWRLDPWPTLGMVGGLVELASSLTGVDYESALDVVEKTLRARIPGDAPRSPKNR